MRIPHFRRCLFRLFKIQHFLWQSAKTPKSRGKKNIWALTIRSARMRVIVVWFRFKTIFQSEFLICYWEVTAQFWCMILRDRRTKCIIFAVLWVTSKGSEEKCMGPADCAIFVTFYNKMRPNLAGVLKANPWHGIKENMRYHDLMTQCIYTVLSTAHNPEPDNYDKTPEIGYTTPIARADIARYAITTQNKARLEGPSANAILIIFLKQNRGTHLQLSAENMARKECIRRICPLK